MSPIIPPSSRGPWGAAGANPPTPTLDPDFPGCDAVPMTWEELQIGEKEPRRVEYWSARSQTAWVLRDGSFAHESPPGVLSEILTRMAMERGSRIRCYGSVFLMERDPDGRPWQVAAADQTVYLHADAARLSGGPAIVRGEGPPPDVILEVDHTTDVRRNKLQLYQAWGLPELWVETPDEPAPSRPPRLKPGLTIYRLDDGVYRTADESRAFPTWTARAIHASLNETRLGRRTLADLTRIGRRFGAEEGTTPDDDPQLGRHRRQAHAAGLQQGRERGIAEALAHQRAFALRLAASKFDPPTVERLAAALALIPDPARLTAACDLILACDNAADLLARLSQSGRPPA